MPARGNSLAMRVPRGQLAELARAAGAGRGRAARRSIAAELPRGPPDAGVLRQRACATSACARCSTGSPTYAPPPRPQPTDGAHGRARRGQGHRLRVQGPGQHGPQAPRPGRVRAPVLGPVPARHEAQHGPAQQADRGRQPDLLLRPRARDRRGGLARRHHRHPQPRPAAGRRRAQRGRAAALHRHPQLRARDPDAGAAGRPDARQAPEGGARGPGRGGRHPGVPAAARRASGSWAWSASCSSTCCRPGSRPSTTCRSASRPPPTSPPAGAARTTPRSSSGSCRPSAPASPLDRDGNPVFLARNNWDLGRVQEDFPKIRFTATRERH